MIEDTGIERVTFFVDGTPEATLTQAPFETEITIPEIIAPGSVNTVRAEALDTGNNTGSDKKLMTVIAIPDTTSPEVSINAHDEAAAGSTLSISAEDSNNSGIASVEFIINGVPVGEGALLLMAEEVFPGTAV